MFPSGFRLRGIRTPSDSHARLAQLLGGRTR
jgi:hypothetical protein